MHHKQVDPNISIATNDTFVLNRTLFVTVAHEDYTGEHCKDCDARHTDCFITPNCTEPCCVFKETTEPEELYALLRLKGEI